MKYKNTEEKVESREDIFQRIDRNKHKNKRNWLKQDKEQDSRLTENRELKTDRYRKKIGNRCV
jgi:hypothetical protein